MPEISDAEFDTLRKGKELLDQLLRSPKTKRTVERQIKALHPDTVISDDFDAPVHDEVKAIRGELREFIETQKNQNFDAELDRQFERLRADGGFTDEGIEKVKKIMVDRKISSPLDAATIWNAENPPPKPQQPSQFAGTSWGFGKQTAEPDTKLLFEDEDAFAEQETQRFFNELSAKQA